MIQLRKPRGELDIVVGGQFGDEGKGSISAWLADSDEYTFAVRVGGYNAEHRFEYERKVYTGRVLPCALINSKMALFLGAGHLFSIKALQEEMEKSNVSSGRVVIDHNVGIVTEEHMGQSKRADRSKRGGTTGQGAGKAATHKVLRDGKFLVAHQYPKLKEDYRVADVAYAIRSRLNLGECGLLEGSQGALISLNHGEYPFCCAKDVTPAGVLAETGAGIKDVRDIFAVYRSYPMRVPGESGPAMGQELSWPELERKIGKKLSENEKRQTLPDGSKGEYERIFEWDWEEYRKSIRLCGPTKLVLTFADWIDPKSKEAKEFDDLPDKVREHVFKMEDEAFQVLKRDIKVICIRTGGGEEDFVLRLI